MYYVLILKLILSFVYWSLRPFVTIVFVLLFLLKVGDYLHSVTKIIKVTFSKINSLKLTITLLSIS